MFCSDIFQKKKREPPLPVALISAHAQFYIFDCEWKAHEKVSHFWNSRRFLFMCSHFLFTKPGQVGHIYFQSFFFSPDMEDQGPGSKDLMEDQGETLNLDPNVHYIFALGLELYLIFFEWGKNINLPSSQTFSYSN